MREHWDETLEHWKESLKILDFMLDVSGPSAATVNLSIAHVLHKQGHIDKSAEKEASARECLKSETARRYHFTSFDSYWRDTTISEFSQWTDPSPELTPPIDN